MSRKPLSPVGALHPALFCVGMYIVALFFSVFICSSIFYAINQPDEKLIHKEETALRSTTTVANASSAVIASAIK